MTDPWTPNQPPSSGQGAPPPGYGPPAGYGPNPYGPPPGYGPPRRSNTRKILLIVLVAFVLLAGACGTGGFLLYRSTIKVNADAVNSFLSDLKAQRYDAAYGRLCANARAQGTAEEFARQAAQARAKGRGVQSYDINNVETNSTTGRRAGGTVTFTDGSRRLVAVGLLKENGTVCVNKGIGPFLD